MRICSICGETKEDKQFYSTRSRCKSCISILNKKKYQEDKEFREKKKKAASEYHEANIDRIKQRRKKFYSENADRIKQERKKAYWLNPEPQRVIAAEWRQKNKNKVRGYNASRKKTVSLHTPPWSDRKKTLQVYEDCPDDMTVDHIIPIKGITPEGHAVCGLHVHWNLRYLSLSENCSRRNIISDEDDVLAHVR